MEISRRKFGQIAAAGGAELAVHGHALPAAADLLIARFTSTPTSPQSLDIQEHLFDIEKRAVRTQSRFEKAAPEIAEVALELLDQKLSPINPGAYDPAVLRSRLHFEWERQYRQSQVSNTGCRDYKMSEDEFGRVQFESNQIYLNLSECFSAEHPVFSLFATVVHEAQHAAAPKRNIVPAKQLFDTTLGRNVALTQARGLGVFAPITELSIQGKTCLRGYKLQIEEGVIHQSTNNILSEVGFTIPGVASYERWAGAYQRFVLDRWFSGDKTSLLSFQQHTKDEDFFKMIGKLWGAPDEKSEAAGDVYTRFVFLDNKLPPIYSDSLLGQ